jgi:putative membrane protein insertion efficiency factor
MTKNGYSRKRFYLTFMLKKTIIFLIKLYQHTLSPDHGPLRFFRHVGACRFRPTCSEYAMAAVEKYGAFKGSWLAFRRLLKCHPFNSGGWDPIK